MNHVHASHNPPTDVSVYNRYVDETVTRLFRLSPLVAAGELIIMLLDLQNGLFRAHWLNHLNLFSELMLIISSVLVFIVTNRLQNQKNIENRKKLTVIVFYRVIVMLAILLFISTDILVRRKALGAYLVFLFLLQITPAYKASTNWIQFSFIGLYTVILYASKVSATRMSTLFTTLVIFIAIALCTEFLRRYSIRQLEESCVADNSRDCFERLSEQTIYALADAVEAKDMYTKGHSQRVAEYSGKIATRMGLSANKCHDIFFIGLMHDLGKIGIPDAVINKAGRLTDEEYAEIKRHPVIGYDILKRITELEGLDEGARWHHERYDGKGYPDGLAGEAIPLIARIIAVADAYDAMTSNRSYRPLMSQATVRQQIETNIGKQFDPEIAGIMLQMIDEDTEYTMHE